MLLEALSAAAVDERAVWAQMWARTEPGPLLEIGCGNGEMLAFLAESTGPHPAVGLDTSSYLLDPRRNVAASAPNVVLVEGDACRPPFPEGTFQSVFLNKVVHEIWADHGHRGTVAALTACARMLRPGGQLIIRENVRPDPRPVSIRLETERARTQFWRFCAQFEPRAVGARWLSSFEVELDIGDALEFLTKKDDPNWAAEMHEPHFTFFEGEWPAVLGEHALLSDIAIAPDELTPVPVFDEVALSWQPEPYKHVIAARKPRV
jgi:SAM-dependent methyltransferase